MNIKGLKFYQTCEACPEQYDVLDDNEEQVGYVRLRWGELRCDYPDCGGETIYYAEVGNEWTGCFKNEEQRMEHLNNIADKILEKMKTDLQKYKDFFDEMGIGYEVTKHRNGMTSLDIDTMHIYYSYGNSISIIFDDEENFVEFQAFGE